MSLQQPGVKLPPTQTIHIYLPNQQFCWMGKMCSGSEISGMVTAGWHWMWGVLWYLLPCNATACLICTGMETVSSTNNVVMLVSVWAETAQRQNNNNCLPRAYKKSVAEKQDSARDHNGRNILFSISVDFQIASCSLSEFCPHYNLRKVELLRWPLPFHFPSLPTAASLLFFAMQGTELLRKSAAAGEGWTCLETVATKARLSSVIRPLKLLWEFLRLALSALQRGVWGEAAAPLFLQLMTQTGIASPWTLPPLGWSLALCCPNPSVQTTVTTWS